MNQTENSSRTRAHALDTCARRTVLRVLVICEESQRVATAFRELGHEAYSCDLQQAGGHRPEWHIRCRAEWFLQGNTTFNTQDGRFHCVDHWDLIIAHPPCTYICKLSSVQLVKDGQVDPLRLEKMYQAVAFFHMCLDAPAKYVAVENPIPMKRAGLPRPTTYVEPFWYGSKYTKKTLLWLKNLPPLMPERVKIPTGSLVHCSRGKYRSRTYQGLAEAMARQWSAAILENYQTAAAQ